MKKINISLTKPLSELIPSKTKETYPLILALNVTRQTNRKFIGWCYAHEFYNLQDILQKSPRQIYQEVEDDAYSSDLSETRLESVFKNFQNSLPKTTLNDYIVKKTNKIVQKVLENIEYYFEEYEELSNVYRIEEYSIDFTIVVLMTELCREGIVIPDEVYGCIEAALRTIKKGTVALSKKDKLEYCYKHNIKLQNERGEMIRIDPCFEHVKIYNTELGELNGLQFEDLHTYYHKRFEERIRFLYPFINKVGEDWETKFYEIIKKDQDYETMYKRYVDKKSLQAIGNVYGISREAVRLQECRFINKYDDFVKCYIEMISKNSPDYFRVFETKEMIDLFLSRPSLYGFDKYKIENGYFFKNKYFSNVFDKVVKKMDGDGYMTQSEFKDAITEVCQDSTIGELLTKCYLREGMLIQYANSYVLTKKGRKLHVRDLTGHIMHKHFKEGIRPLNKSDVERFNQIAKEEMGLKEINGHALQARLALCQDIILSSNGGYAHIDFFRISSEALTKLEEDIETRIDKCPVNSFGLFNRNMNLLIKEGIDNPTLLYGILRYIWPDKYIYKKLAVYPKSDGNSICKRYYVYLQEHPDGVTKEEMQKAVGKINPGSYTNFIQNYPIMYYKKSNTYSIFNADDYPKDLIAKAKKQIEEDFDKYKFCPTERLFMAFEKEWRDCGLTHYIDLSYACRGLFKDFVKVKNNILVPFDDDFRFSRKDILYAFMKAEGLSGSDYAVVRDRLREFLGIPKEEMSKKFCWYLNGKGISVTKDKKIII